MPMTPKLIHKLEHSGYERSWWTARRKRKLYRIPWADRQFWRRRQPDSRVVAEASKGTWQPWPIILHWRTSSTSRPSHPAMRSLQIIRRRTMSIAASGRKMRCSIAF